VHSYAHTGSPLKNAGAGALAGIFSLPPLLPLTFYSLSSPTKFGLRPFLGACAGSRMSLGVLDWSSTQALEDIIAGAYQTRWARVSALVMLLWDHGTLAIYLPAPYTLLTDCCAVTCLDREVELVWVRLRVSRHGHLN